MFEPFFGLRKRPFAALPDADCFVPLEGICQAFDGLFQAAAEGRGIGVLSAPAGLGKSLVCQRLARELSANFRVVLLPSGNFLTRRSLLQAILFELGHSFVRMGDQELRLALSATLRALRPAQRGLVLIVDEAHLLAARMLEELRALLSFGEAGEPLVRLIVSGQLSLEETLSRPECDAFNQRIACQVMLPLLTREESSSYLTRRLAWAGVNVSEVFTRESLTAVCEAADGVPRCLHQLADHCLSLATTRSEKPIILRTVREALDHLKQLPLAWAEPTIGRATTNPLEAARAQATAMADASVNLSESIVLESPAAESANRELLDEALIDTYPLRGQTSDQVQLTENSRLAPQSAKNCLDDDSHAELVSFWSDEESADSFEQAEPSRDAYTGVADNDAELYETVPSTVATVSSTRDVGESNEINNSIELELSDASDATWGEVAESELLGAPQRTTQQTLDAEVLPEIESTLPLPGTAVDEEVVIDRYAALDSAINRLTRTMLNVQANARRKATESVIAPASPSVPPIPIEAIDAVHQGFDVVLPEDELIDEQPLVTSGANSTITAERTGKTKEYAIERAMKSVREPVADSSAVAAGAPVATASSTREATPRATADERRPYQLLFSELRRRRRRV
ncbi:MAG TPA: AAA family ATPase [Planctomycetaceae bacterium]|jgi:type II secretory pathway predicted ATPase ExeA|nr:AAA family ATPase [Planctomycetaceae bacterium]